MLNTLDLYSTNLELRHATGRVKCRIGETIDRLQATPVEWHKNRIFADTRSHFYSKQSRAAWRGQLRCIAIRQSVTFRGSRVNLYERGRRHITQRLHALRLSARLILR